MKKRIDLNCDLGEWKTSGGASLDESIMPFISSCNIACGGHIGNEESMRSTIRLAEKYGVKIGIHPSYPDKKNFGRIVMDISSEELEQSLYNQMSTFKKYLDNEGAILHHIKPHGALYNQAAKDQKIAKIVISVIKQMDLKIPIYLPPISVSKRLAVKAGLKVVQEVFADRAYEIDLSLRDRSLNGAVIDNEKDILTQLKSMVFKNEVLTYSGIIKPIIAETICLHSDTNGAVQLAKTIHEFLKNNGIEIIPT